MANNRLKIENLQNLNIRELTPEETASLQGGMLIAGDTSYNPEPGKYSCDLRKAKKISDGVIQLPYCMVIL